MNIAVTGSFLSGKSTFARFLAEFLEWEYFSCDDFINELYTLKEIQKKIVDNFGKKTYFNNIIQKKYLSDLVFKSQKNLNTLENILYPLLFSTIEKRIENKIPTVYEVPLLYEKGLHKKMDYCILVKGDSQKIAGRARLRGYDLSEVKKRLNYQSDDSEKEKYKPIIVNNNRTIIDLKQEAFRVSRLLS